MHNSSSVSKYVNHILEDDVKTRTTRKTFLQVGDFRFRTLRAVVARDFSYDSQNIRLQ